eukprot:scaffold24215_cov129-Isochrysis_galbana.AAC.2
MNSKASPATRPGGTCTCRGPLADCTMIIRLSDMAAGTVTRTVCICGTSFFGLPNSGMLARFGSLMGRAVAGRRRVAWRQSGARALHPGIG